MIKAQAFALRLLVRGLRPKQVAIATGISQWKVNDLRKGLMPDDRLARPPMSVATIPPPPPGCAPALRSSSAFIGASPTAIRIPTIPGSCFSRATISTRFSPAAFRTPGRYWRSRMPARSTWRSKAALVASAACDRHGHALSGRARARPRLGLSLIARWKPANGRFPSDADAEICARTVQQSLDRAVVQRSS